MVGFADLGMEAIYEFDVAPPVAVDAGGTWTGPAGGSLGKVPVAVGPAKRAAHGAGRWLNVLTDSIECPRRPHGLEGKISPSGHSPRGASNDPDANFGAR